ncbi:MAG TPA: hydroxysqualene dehydroxylase HpnE [Burkholderiaceae bacterium]|nr:hydroxysqualene dehydroxylase HpnE [Burkholderiaceae bacterium]
MASRGRLAVVGGGWAGLAAAVEGVRLGHAVTLFEMAPQLGGRARRVEAGGEVLDNGQHILIGAYVDTLALLARLGVSAADAFERTPLRLMSADGFGLALRAGAPLPAFAAAVLRRRGWRVADRLALLAAAAGWAARGFRCDPSLTVAALTARLPRAVRDDLIEPLCVAALNTPGADASAGVFLRVLKDALFAGAGSADLLLPRVDLSALLPEPAARWLRDAGAAIRLAHRVDSLAAAGAGWSIDGEAFDRVVLAATPVEAARLTRTIAPAWSASATALRYEPIVTVYLHADGVRLPEAMLALHADAHAPAQFVFDRGRLGGRAGLLAFVISGAQAWVDHGIDETARATLAQARAVLVPLLGGRELSLVQTLTEKRATFRCTPGLQRAPLMIAAQFHAAGDHVDGPYPATLEGAVRSGLAAVRRFA